MAHPTASSNIDTVGDLRVRKTYAISVLAVNRGEQVFREDVRQVSLRAGDTLVLAGGADPELDTDGLAALAADSAKAAGGWTPARFVVWGGALPRLLAISAGQAAQLAYNPALSGMILNFNRVHLGWRCEAGCTLALEGTTT